MAEYVRKDAVLWITTELGAWETQNRVRELPVEDVQPVKHGRWDFQGYQLFKCTNCAKIYTQNQLEDIGENWAFPDFCPNCGARMIKEGEQND